MARSNHTARTTAQAFRPAHHGAGEPQPADALQTRRSHRYEDATRVGALVPDPMPAVGIEVARATIEPAVRRVVGALADLAGGHHLPVVVRQRLQLALGDLPAAIVGDAARRRYPGQQPRVGVVLAGERNTGDSPARRRPRARQNTRRRRAQWHAGARLGGYRALLHPNGAPRRSWSTDVTWLFFSWHEWTRRLGRSKRLASPPGGAERAALRFRNSALGRRCPPTACGGLSPGWLSRLSSSHAANSSGSKAKGPGRCRPLPTTSCRECSVPDLDAELLHQPRVLHRVVLRDLGELLRRAAAGSIEPLGEALLHGRIGQRLPISALSRVTIAAGVPFGTKAAYQASSTRPLKPTSSSVGTSCKYVGALRRRLRDQLDLAGLIVRHGAVGPSQARSSHGRRPGR